MRVLSLIIAVVLYAAPAWSLEIAGVEVEEKVVNDAGTTLQLNGAGIRTKFFFKIYIAELYMENPQEKAAKVIADDGAKRVVMHFLYDEVGRDQIVQAWQDGFMANTGEASLHGLEQRIEKFNALFTEDMKEGETIVFDYLPGQGTRVTVKGEDKGLIEGRDFNDALLAIWLGEEPVGEDLKRALLKR